MTRLLKGWKRWAALGAAFLLVLLLWLALVAGRVAGEPLRLTLWADCLPLDRAGLRAPSRCTTEPARLKSPTDSAFPWMKEEAQVTLISALPAVAVTLLS